MTNKTSPIFSLSEIEKGCGIWTIIPNFPSSKIRCGEYTSTQFLNSLLVLCPSCKLKLQTTQHLAQNVKEVLDERIKYYEEEEIKQRKLTKGYEGLSSDEKGAGMMKNIRNLTKQEKIKIIFEEGKTETFNLSWADLSWANLRGANLSLADLSWANLRGAKGEFIFNYGVKLKVVSGEKEVLGKDEI